MFSKQPKLISLVCMQILTVFNYITVIIFWPHSVFRMAVEVNQG